MQRLFLKMHKNFIFSFKMHKNLIWMYKICSDKIKIAWSSIFKSFKKIYYFMLLINDNSTTNIFKRKSRAIFTSYIKG